MGEETGKMEAQRRLTIIGYSSCPYFQMAKKKAEEIGEKRQDLLVEVIAKRPNEFRQWVRENSLAIAQNHVSSPACYIGDYTAEVASKENFLIGGNDKFQVWVRKSKKGSSCTLQ